MADWLDRLTALEDPAERKSFLADNLHALPPEAPAEIHARVLVHLYSELNVATRLARACEELAGLRQESSSQAFAARCQGHVAYSTADYELAAAAYERAATLFEQNGDFGEVGRSLLSGLQTLAYLGRYEQARNWADRAETIFVRLGDVLRLARLDINVGNIYFRQDRPQDAVLRYQRALEGLREVGDSKDLGALYSNLAVCQTSMGLFNEALENYKLAREHCDAHGLIPLAAQADYNIAYLYYLRGEYTEARKLYQLSRERCRAAGDAYHLALCDLDEAEMNLELNLTREGELYARRAAQGFAKLSLAYEQAKAIVNIAVAASQAGNLALADRTLSRARGLFRKEGNAVWCALVDQLRGVLAFQQQRFTQAQRLSSAAWRVLSETTLPGRAAHSQIVLARLWLRSGYPARARSLIRQALDRLGGEVSPSLRFHINMLDGEICEMQGRWTEALASYESAQREVEDLRGRVDTEDLRISVLKDKLGVYEALVSICLESPLSRAFGGALRALSLVQQAKSRTLADRLGAPGPLSANGPGAQLYSLRKDLNALYKQLDIAATSSAPNTPHTPNPVLLERIRSIESQLLEAQSADLQATFPAAGLPSMDAIRAAIPENALLLEYFEVRGVLYLFLIGQRDLEVIRLCETARVRQVLSLLRFQLGKFRMVKAAVQSSPATLEATNFHLGELYEFLIAPARHFISRYSHLIIAPHRELHGVPFAALHESRVALIDRFTLSLTPSAAVFASCRARTRTPSLGALVMAVPDAAAPQIAEEAVAVSQLLGSAELITGPDASVAAFLSKIPGKRIVHLAAHGIFRRDNPMFSALQLSDGRLSLFDIQGLNLSVELLTLSACSSGSAVNVGGDELLGLMRGFLGAGAQSILVALWEIDDASTNDFMRDFYQRLTSGESLASAVQKAMMAVRTLHPHPYYWAPFLLIGDPCGTETKSFKNPALSPDSVVDP